MVEHLRLCTHELLYEEIGNIYAKIWSAFERAVLYEEVNNHSERIFNLFKILIFGFLFHLLQYTLKNRKIIILNQSKDTLRMIGYLDWKVAFL